jgi:DNA replication factor GINS
VYNDLYKAWKAEKTSDKPQPLPSDFYQRAAGYLRGLQEDSAASDTRSIQGRLLAGESQKAQRLLDELKQTRLDKIVNALRDGHPINTDELIEEEKNLVKQLTESLLSFKGPTKETPGQELTEETTQLLVVRFLNNVPEIVGVDMKLYGPYKKEDVGSLPIQNANALIKQGLAKEVDVKRTPHIAVQEAIQLHQQ